MAYPSEGVDDAVVHKQRPDAGRTGGPIVMGRADTADTLDDLELQVDGGDVTTTTTSCTSDRILQYTTDEKRLEISSAGTEDTYVVELPVEDPYDGDGGTKGDEDEGGEESSLSDIEHMDCVDRAANITVDVLFFVGCVLYVIVAIWDVYSNSALKFDRPEINITTPGIDTPDVKVGNSAINVDIPDLDTSRFTINTSGTTAVHNFVDNKMLSVLSLMAPILFLAYGVVNVAWAGRNMRRHQGQSHRRRNAWYDMGGSAFWSLASLLEVLAEVGKFGGVGRVVPSAHLYMTSAVISMAGLDVGSFFTSRQVKLTVVGDTLFLIGSTIDLIVTYMPNLIASGKLWILGSFFWFFNSILYLLADFLIVLYKCCTKA